MFELKEEQMERYVRNIVLPEVGISGQKRLLSSKVLIIGTGGLGSPVGFYLAAAGIGKLGLVDSDDVEISNLQRQILHSTPDIGRPKCESAKEKLLRLNPDIEVITYKERITSSNVMDIIKDYEVIVNCPDNFPTRYLVNDACIFSAKPNIYGAVFKFEGQTTVFLPKKGPCYRCLYPEPPPEGLLPPPQQAGPLGVIPGVIGIIQATETIKLILGIGELLFGRLLTYDGLQMKFKEFPLNKNQECPICGDNPTIKELIDYEEFCQPRE